MAPSVNETVKAALNYLLISSYGRTRTYRVASLRAGLVGHILFNMYFDCNMCDLIKYMYLYLFFYCIWWLVLWVLIL